MWCLAKDSLSIIEPVGSESWEVTGTAYKCLKISGGRGTWGFSAGRPEGNRTSVAEGSKGKGNIAVSHQEVLSGQELSFAHDNLPKRDTFEVKHKVH